jgi:competence protein ComEC
LVRLSSVHRTIDQLLIDRGLERAPWLAVGYGAGIGAWVALPGPWAWCAFLALCAAAVMLALLILRTGTADHLAQALAAMALVMAAGCATIWTKSATIGTTPIPGRMTGAIAARIVDRQDDGADGIVRMTLAARLAPEAPPVLMRVALPDPLDRPDLRPGAVITAKARLAPPAPPLLPGARDFAFAAWFDGIAATGSLSGPIAVVTPAAPAPSLGRVQAALRDHVLAHLGGPAGALAATLASGDRGALSRGDDLAMRDAGFAHLLSISGLHVSAVIAAVYLLVLWGLGLVPWIALRVRLPVAASGAAALAGVAYCLITGSQVPTIRAAAGAVLALGALALGRDPLSMRLLAAAAFLILLFWPEVLVGASFQMSFGAVIAVIALCTSAPMRAFLRPREEALSARLARRFVIMLLGGVVIELAVLPIALVHFHRAGVYGALANLLAVPLVLCVAMPALGAALLLDGLGLGAPAWWVVGHALDAVLAIARFTAGLPGSVTALPGAPGWIYVLWIAGALWAALWSGRGRWWGLLPVMAACACWAMVRAPDVLIAGDGRHVGITGLGSDLVVLDQTRGSFARDSLLAEAGMAGTTRAVEDWPGARCGHDFCALAFDRYGQRWVLLIARSHRRLNEEGLARACAQSDLVIDDTPLPATCRPRRLLVDGALLARTGGMTIDLSGGTIRTVAQTSGRHPWLRAW